MAAMSTTNVPMHFIIIGVQQYYNINVCRGVSALVHGRYVVDILKVTEKGLFFS